MPKIRAQKFEHFATFSEKIQKKFPFGQFLALFLPFAQGMDKLGLGMSKFGAKNGQIWAKMVKFGLKWANLGLKWTKFSFGLKKVQFFTFWRQILYNTIANSHFPFPFPGPKLAPKLDFFELSKVKYF